MFSVKMLCDANIPGAGSLSKNQRVLLNAAQIVFAVNRGFIDESYLDLIAPPAQMVDTPVSLTEEPPVALVVNKDTQKDAPPLLPVGKPEDNEPKGSRKKKTKEE